MYSYDDIPELLKQIDDLKADRDRLRASLDRIATDYDCDPRAEARAALEGKP